MQLSSDLFYQAIQALENHSESLRIKKLIFCLCQKTWENDINILNHLSLETLVTELVQKQSTIEELTLSLYQLVKTLNRPKIYGEVAKAIIKQLSPLYQDIDTPTIFLKPAPNPKDTQVSDLNFLLEQAASNLQYHPETARIQKLIYAITKNTWENNLNQIQNYGLKKLISEILEIYPTNQELADAFSKLVENINKKTLYLAISKIIVEEMSGLYDYLSVKEKIKKVDSSSDNIQIISINRDQHYNNLETKAESVLETSVIDITPTPMITDLKQVEIVEKPAKKAYDIFEIRLEIMQYTNPLRAKILLFSLLFHPWDRSGQDWSMLKSYSLDDLLEQIIQSDSPVAEIEAKLYDTAQSLKEPDNYLQVASTIIEAIKPFI